MSRLGMATCYTRRYVNPSEVVLKRAEEALKSFAENFQFVKNGDITHSSLSPASAVSVDGWGKHTDAIESESHIERIAIAQTLPTP